MRVILIATVVLVSCLPLASQNADQQRDTKRKQISAMREGGLKSAASITGSFVSAMDFTPQYFEDDLKSMFSHSLIVVRGTAVSNKCVLSPNGQQIYTEYVFAISGHLKEPLKQARSITVSLPGGRVSFSDGSLAEVRTPGFRKMENGKDYVLFLDVRSDGGEGYFLHGGPQGLVELPADGSEVHLNSFREFPVSREINGKKEEAFLKHLKNLPDAKVD